MDNPMNLEWKIVTSGSPQLTVKRVICIRPMEEGTSSKAGEIFPFSKHIFHLQFVQSKNNSQQNLCFFNLSQNMSEG